MGGERATCPLVCVQANVLLLEGEARQHSLGVLESGKILHLSAQFAEVGIGIAFIHEARSSGPCCRASGAYLAVCGGCTDVRQNGEEIWINVESPFQVNGRSVTISEHDVHVIVAEPSVLLAELRVGPLCLLLLAAHAPHSRSRVQQGPWWDRLRQIVRPRLRAGRPLLFGIDANGQVGPPVPPWCGGHQPDAVNEGGRRLLQFCELVGCCLPQTFAQHHRGHAVTWRSKKGDGHRIDFIGWPYEWVDQIPGDGGHAEH